MANQGADCCRMVPIYRSAEWPGWWKGVQDEIIQENDAMVSMGSEIHVEKHVALYIFFWMKLVEKEDRKLLQGIAFGELEGEGTWYFQEENCITKVQYHWNVKTNKAWMNYFAFILKPIFKFNHNIVMRWGAKGLAKKLNIYKAGLVF